jgi:hypothetical protein
MNKRLLARRGMFGWKKRLLTRRETVNTSKRGFARRRYGWNEGKMLDGKKRQLGRREIF